jgi:hypothetical protein
VVLVQLAPVTINQVEVKDEKKKEKPTILEAIDNKDWEAVMLRTNFAQN